METFEEPLTKQQREELEGIVAFSTQFGRALLFVTFVVLVGAVFRWLQHFLWDGFPIWIVPTIAIGAWLYVRSGRWTGGPKLRHQICQDLAAGKVLVTVLKPVEVEVIEELEDEGPSFILKSDGGECILLTGQEMSRYKSKKFPSAKVGVVETPNSKRFLGLRRLGDPMQVTKKRPPLAYERAKALGCFERSFIVLDESKRKLLGEP